jgi:hypothetical protein
VQFYMEEEIELQSNRQQNLTDAILITAKLNVLEAERNLRNAIQVLHRAKETRSYRGLGSATGHSCHAG